MRKLDNIKNHKEEIKHFTYKILIVTPYSQNKRKKLIKNIILNDIELITSAGLFWAFSSSGVASATSVLASVSDMLMV